MENCCLNMGRILPAVSVAPASRRVSAKSWTSKTAGKMPAVRENSILAKDAYNAALNLYVRRRNNNGWHFGIRGLQTNLSARLTIKALQRGFIISDQRHNRF